VRFLSRHCGSVLVTQCLEHFLTVFSRLRARRTLLSEVGQRASPARNRLGQPAPKSTPTIEAFVAWTAMEQVTLALAPFLQEGRLQPIVTPKSVQSGQLVR
jgi:hypothetical protein